MLKGKKLTIFVRFGGLNIKPQKGFGNNTYHSPPTTKGFYAMPLCVQEFFLIGSLDIYQKGTMPKKPKGDNITNEEWDTHYKRRKKSLSVKRKQFTKTEGNIWHHLEEYTNKNEIVSSHNSWVKTSIKAWEKAFSKMTLHLRYGEGQFAEKTVNSSKFLGYYSKDHCEVFFDEKV